MKHLGLRAMRQTLNGDFETIEILQASLGKIIKDLSLKEDALHFVFEDGSKMKMFDDGQNCFEARYMVTDDNLDDFRESTFLDAEIKEGPSIEDEWGETHEIQFLIIKTSVGEFTMATHNEHNGFYGGFAIVAKTE